MRPQDITGKNFLKNREKIFWNKITIFFSVIGRPSAGGLCFPEYVIYRGEQAYPEYLINYLIQKPTWPSPRKTRLITAVTLFKILYSRDSASKFLLPIQKIRKKNRIKTIKNFRKWMSDLYASPDALRSPLTTTRRFNQQDNTPVSNVSSVTCTAWMVKWCSDTWHF